eukprot:383004_1
MTDNWLSSLSIGDKLDVGDRLSDKWKIATVKEIDINKIYVTIDKNKTSQHVIGIWIDIDDNIFNKINKLHTHTFQICIDKNCDKINAGYLCALCNNRFCSCSTMKAKITEENKNDNHISYYKYHCKQCSIKYEQITLSSAIHYSIQ